MGIDAISMNGIDEYGPEYVSDALYDGLSNGENGMVDSDAVEMLAELDLELAYSSEKLMNLDLYMAIVSLGENELGELSLWNEKISEADLEIALTFDLSFSYLDFEITELGHFLIALRAKIIDAHQKIYFCRQRGEISILQGKLQAAEESWKQLHEQLSEMKKQLTNLSRAGSFITTETKHSVELEDFGRYGFNLKEGEEQRLVLRMLEKSLASELDLEKQFLKSKEREERMKSKLYFTNDLVSNYDAFAEVALERLLEAQNSAEIYMGIVKEIISRLQIIQSNLHSSVQREEELKSILVLKSEIVSNIEAFSEVALERLLETEFSSEIFLGIAKEMMSRLQILQFNVQCSVQREEELKSKLSLTNEVVSNMEAFSEDTLENLLVAEHLSEIYKGTAKELMSRLQILQFSLTCSNQREEELKVKLQGSLKHLKENEITLMESKTEKFNQISREKETLEEKLKVLEEKLQSAETQLAETKVSYDASLGEVSLMKDEIESLTEHVFVAESTVHNAETKITALTEENLELREEVGFLKGGDAHEEKISMLEKQLRELEVQAQNARASSEASLEQQNLLYTAIWDMETLIEELKSKVTKAESRAESAEEQCLVMAENNLDLSKEMGYLKSENSSLKGSLRAANKEKATWVKDINNGAKLITELVMQLAVERERVQKQLSSLDRENKILLNELRKTRRSSAMAQQDNKEKDPINGIISGVSTMADLAETAVSASASNQGDDEPLEQNEIHEAEEAGTSTTDYASAATHVSNHDTEGKQKSKGRRTKSYTFVALLVLLFAILAMNLNWHDISSHIRHQYLGLQ